MPALVYGETRINTSTNGYQQEPAITALADGGYVAAWSGYGVGDTNGIFIQRYSASGAKVGGETLINTTTAGEQKDAVITALANGGYVVSWHNDVDGGDIFAQLYNANGAKMGSESRVNSNTSYEQDSPNITALNDGGYVVAWASYGQDSSGEWGTYLQRYNASGAKVGGETRINSTTAGAQDGPAITGLADGGYLAVWEGNGGGDMYGIFAQRFDSSGTKVGVETRINSTTADLQSDPDITVLANGGYVVSWQSYPDDLDNDEDTQAPGDIYAQLYNASGAKVGGQTRVNTTTAGNQEESNITPMSDGGYLVTWNGSGSGDSAGIFAQRYNASGAKVGGETRINSTTADNQEFAQVTALADGGYLVVWESYNQDGQYSGIYSQRFDANGNKLSGLTGDALANTLTWSGSGSVIIDAGAGNDSLTGGSGNDILNGGAGADRLSGGAGADTYYVDNAKDIVSETSTLATEIDTLQSSVTWTLGANLEKLVLTGSAASNGTGNALNNSLTGNAAANTLSGGAGNDILTGGAGADKLLGGDGSDTYYIDNTGDIVTETNATASTGGTDTVYSSLAAYTLGANVESLRILATGTANGTGNGLNNLIYAGAGNNSLNGSTGTDTVSYAYASSAVSASLATTAAQATGGSGSDILLNFENLTGSNYNDNLTGNAAANTLSGGAGNDLLIGGAGVDRLNGGTGADKFDFNALSELGLGALRDVLGDFKTSEGDKIDLSTLDANAATASNEAFTFIGSTAFSGTNAAGQVRFASGVLYGSTDADSAAEFEISLLGVSTLSSADFIA